MEVVMRHRTAVPLLGLALCAPALWAAGPAQQQPANPSVRIEMLQAPGSNENAPMPLGTEHDVYCDGWLGELREPMAGVIASAEAIDSRDNFMETDLLYLNIGATSGVTPGMEFWVVRPGRTVYKHGSVLDELGRIYDTPGRVRVICVHENSSIVEIVRSCENIQIGDLVLPFEPVPIPIGRRSTPVTSCDVPNGKILGHIVDVKDQAVPIGSGTVVFLDLGEQNGIAPGDFFTVFRPRVSAYGTRTILGEVSVLRTSRMASLAIVTLMHDTMYLGDDIELK
jgi:hypothetical protein